MDTRVLLCEAPAEEIRRISGGEITRSTTVNYSTLRPIRRGLFCEEIFGKYRGGLCACGAYERLACIGPICRNCGVEVVARKIWSEPIGHIDLAVPVTLSSGNVVECVAVISPALRPGVKVGEGRIALHDLNYLYEHLIERNKRLKRVLLKFGDVPGEVVSFLTNLETRLIRESVERLLDNSHCETPYTLDDAGKPLTSIRDLLALLSHDMIASCMEAGSGGNGDSVEERPWGMDLKDEVRRLDGYTDQERFRWVRRHVELYEADNGYVPTAKRLFAGDLSDTRQYMAQLKLIVDIYRELGLDRPMDDLEE